MAIAATDALYAFDYVGAPAGDVAICRTLTFAGPLVIAKDHMLAVMAPDAFANAAVANKVIVQHTTLSNCCYGGFIFDDQLLVQGMHLSVRLDRWAALMQDLKVVGIDCTPMNGSIREVGPSLAARIGAAMLKLPASKRRLTSADVIYDTADKANAETGGWYDHVTPSLLINNGGTELVARFAALTPGCFCGVDTGKDRKSTAFECIIDQMM